MRLTVVTGVGGYDDITGKDMLYRYHRKQEKGAGGTEGKAQAMAVVTGGDWPEVCL